VEETGGTMRSGAAATSVTLELDVLDCTVCWLPLCRPVFQYYIREPPNSQNLGFLSLLLLSAAISLWCRCKF
jgi:hypothetical protein